MKFSIRLLALVSLPAAALALGCSSNKTSQGYTADRGNAPVAPAHLTSTTGAPSQHPQGWSAPVWRGPIPAGGKTVGASTSMPTVTGPVAMTPTPPMSAPVRAQAPTSYGFNWAGSLKEAQDSARAQAKLIFIEAGREACGNCQFLKREVIPSSSVNSELGSMSVGYYDDVNLTPYSDAYNIVAANIQSAGTLPLCGWVTPDLKWVHGFWGRRDATK